MSSQFFIFKIIKIKLNTKVTYYYRSININIVDIGLLWRISLA